RRASCKNPSARARRRCSTLRPRARGSSTDSRSRGGSSCRGRRGGSCWSAPRRSRAFLTGPIARRASSSGVVRARWSVNRPPPAAAALEARALAGLRVEDVDLFLPHQANARIIEAVAKRLGLDRAKVFVDIDRFGNTSAASIPIALCDALAQGRVRQGDTLAFAAFGGGMTWGAAVVEWSSSSR